MLPRHVTSLTPGDYRNPDQLEDGGVLVVGAAATGVQLADEIQRSGRPVTLAVGGHVRLPRMYRGMDIMWWLDAAGVLDERYDEVDDIVRARNVASFQLVGSPARETIDLNALQRIGVRLVGRLGGITDEGTAQFSGSLLNQCTLADLKLGRLLGTLDEWAESSGGPTGAFRANKHPVRPAAACAVAVSRDHDRHLGHRVPGFVPVAPPARARRQGTGAP
jgi:putative flavoprotein involved in K+ transport